MQHWQALLEEAVTVGRSVAPSGRLATYIPELAQADPGQVGIALIDAGGRLYHAGDTTQPFTLQSVSKVLSLALALMDSGEETVFRHVGMEPTGDPYNSIIRLETLPQKPLNPFINAGAIAVCNLIPGKGLTDRVEHMLTFVRELAQNDRIRVNEKVAASERATGHRNRALAYFMKDAGHLAGDVEETLQLYFACCAIEVTTSDLVRIAAHFAFPGQIIPPKIVHIANALMSTCGLYDGSGAFAVQVGIPAKSGVAGGILATSPGRAAIATFGPALDGRGNSVAGIRMLSHLAEHTPLSIFRTN